MYPSRRICCATLVVVTVYAMAAQPEARAWGDPPPQAAGAPNPAGWVITGPETHENLSVFVVSGPQTVAGEYLTLTDALANRQIAVHETEQVSELTVENLSKTPIFIQSGDIVRGGKQDRMLAVDMIVEPGSGRVPIASFCVEQGRWAARGTEASSQFSSSANCVPSNTIKLAAKSAGDQRSVWSGVKKSQDRLQASLGRVVASDASATSLELTLENEDVKKRAASYVQALVGTVERHPDAIGVVLAINGEMYSADVYGSRSLFRKLWPKLLESAAIEAIAAKRDGPAQAAPAAAQARAFLDAARPAAATERTLSARLRWVIRESDDVALFETLDAGHNGACIHTNCLKKERVVAEAGDGAGSQRRGP